MNSVNLAPEFSTLSLSRKNAIEFTDEDLIPVNQPHYDALAITVWMYDCKVRRCLVSTDASEEILFAKAFDELKIADSELHMSTCPLVNFNGSISHANGRLQTTVSLGEMSTCPLVDFN